MDWGEFFKLSIKKVITIIILIILIQLILVFFSNIGGVNYFRMPFPIKVTSCGTSSSDYTNCSFPFVLWGIIASILFWIIAYMIISAIFYRPRENPILQE